MTPRAYWDWRENLWERREVNGVPMAYLLWSPDGPVVGPNCHGGWADISRRMGPMVAVA